MPSYLAPGLFDGDAAPRAWPWGDLEPCAYDFIMADPPWDLVMYSEAGREKSPAYRCMSIEDIAALPVADLAGRDCLLWLWGTTPMLPQQLAVMAAWGFKYSTNGVWAKRTRHGKRHFGTGYGGFRNEHEHILVGRIGSPQFDDRSIRSIIEGTVREHSRKPEAAYLAAEQLMPTARRASLFERVPRAGWDGWGDQYGQPIRQRVRVVEQDEQPAGLFEAIGNRQ